MFEDTLCQSYIRITLVVVSYWIISIGMVFVNKEILSGSYVELNAPIFVTFYQCCCAIVFTLIINLFNKRYQYSFLEWIQFPVIHVSWRRIKDTIPLTITFVGMIVLNNYSLKHMEIAFYFVGRSLSTVFNVIFTYFILGERTSLPAILCCGVIIVGFILGCDRESISGDVNHVGITFGLLASIFVSLNSIFAKKVLPKLDQNVWLVNFYNNLLGFFLFIPLLGVSGEVTSVLNYQQFNDLHFWLLMAGSALFAYLIAFASVLQIKTTSPLTHNISGTVKACIQTVLAVIINSQQKEFLWWLSNALVILGSLAYTRIRQLEMKERISQELKMKNENIAETDSLLVNMKSV